MLVNKIYDSIFWDITWALNGHLFFLCPSSLQNPHLVCFCPSTGDLAYLARLPNFCSISVSFLGDSDHISSFVLPSDSRLALKFPPGYFLIIFSHFYPVMWHIVFSSCNLRLFQSTRDRIANLKEQILVSHANFM